MARRLVAFAGVLVGFIRGGLSLVNIMASTFFGAISGSSVADTASIGSVLIPEMEKKGHPRPFAAAVTVSGSVQAILIPPSHNAVIYSLAAGGTVSIAALFMAGVLPGLLMGLVLAILCLIIAKRENYPKGEVIPRAQALKITVEALWSLMTMVIILGGILSGVFTANESTSVAVLWAFIVTMFVYRDYQWRDLPRLMYRTVRTVTIVTILIGLAACFTDPPFGILGWWEGEPATPELPHGVYRIDPINGELTCALDDLQGSNGLAFSPDERVMYVVESRSKPHRLIWAYDVAGDRLVNKRLFVSANGPGAYDGIAVDHLGNVWCGLGSDGSLAAKPAELDGVRVYDPAGKPLAHIHLPERCANLCFGGTKRNRLFMAASHSLYALHVNVRGAVA